MGTVDLQLYISQASFPLLRCRSGSEVLWSWGFRIAFLSFHGPLKFMAQIFMDVLSSCQVEDHRGPCSKVATFLGFPAENQPLSRGIPLIWGEYIKKNHEPL